MKEFVERGSTRRWGRTAVMLLLALIMATSNGWAFAAAAEEDVLAEETVPPLTAETAKEFLDSFFMMSELENEYVGATVAIVRDGETIALRGFGYADKENGIEVDPTDTVFRVASVSKTFVAAAIMQLVEQGIVDLQADIREYIPDLQFDNPFDVPVTVEHLLLHKSGLQVKDPHLHDDILTDSSVYYGIEEYVHEHMPPVVRLPGSAYMYDNFAYLLLGLIVQEASGVPFVEYMENAIFKPLGMTNSSFSPRGPIIEQLANGYDASQQPLDFYVLKPTDMPHGGMLSTAEDIARFMTALLNGGVGENGERILSESSVAAMMEYRSYTHPLLPDTTYGFEAGFQLPQAGSSDKIVTKAGDLPGFSSYLFLIPEQNTGVFISYNQNGALREWFYGQFIATFFPQYAAPAQFDDVVASTVEQLAAFNGLYADLRLGSILTSVEAVEDGQLLVRDAYLGPRTLHQIDENLFADQMLMLFTAFQVDERTGSTYMKEPYLNPLGQAGRAPEPQGFADVGADHPYAEAIYTLQSLGHYPNDGEALFDPERPLTRAEFIRLLFDVSKIVPTQSKDYAFVDIEGHVDAAYIHSAYLLGGAVGDGEGKFEPDRPITRQEAAVFIWLQLRQAYPDELFESISLAGDTSPWAVPAVKMMVALGLYGPEVVVSEDGAVDYLSRQVLTHEQSAAILYETLVQPMNLIVAELAAAAADEDESIEIKSGEVHKVEVELGDDNEAEVEAEVKIEADTEADADVDVEIEVETDPEAETEVETEPVRSP